MLKLGKRDIAAVILLFAMVAILSMGLLDKGHNWGDDFAAYLLEARAIANGTMEEQSRINPIIHASEMSFGDQELPETLTYVWGYPLALSAIYRAVGYNFAYGGIPIVYKIPNVAAYGLFVVIVFLFYRRRFSFGASACMAALFAGNSVMLTHTNELMTDIFCLTLSMAALLLVELYLECGTAKKKVLIGAVLGAVLWYNYEVRLNGVTIIYMVLLAHALHLMKNRPNRREWAIQLVPYAVLLVLLGISLCMFPAATSNTGHIASGPSKYILPNIRFYNGEIGKWVASMLPGFVPCREYAHYLMYVLIAIGVLYAGITKNLHLTALMIGTFAVLFLLPYMQPIRYLFNALPLMMMFAAYGIIEMARTLVKMLRIKRSSFLRVCCNAMMILLVIGMMPNTIGGIREHAALGGMEYRYGAYGSDALDIYAYIRENTAEDALIGCLKPRAMTLNTDRISYIPGINGNKYKDAHYILLFEDETLYDSVAESIWPELWNELTEVYRNDSFVLYEMSEVYRLSK